MIVDCKIVKNLSLMEKIKSLLSDQQYEEAFSALDNAIEQYPDDVEYPEISAETLFRLGLLDFSINYIDRAVQLGSRKVKLHRMKATILMNNGNLEDAAKEVKEGIDLVGKDSLEHSNLLIISAVMKSYESGNEPSSRAAELVEEAQRINTTNPDIILVGAYISALNNNVNEFRKYSQMFMDEGIDVPEFMYLLIKASSRLREFSMAQKLSEKLRANTDGNGVSDYTAFLTDYELKKLNGEEEKFFQELKEFIAGNVEKNRKIELLNSILRMDSYSIPVIRSVENINLNTYLINNSDPELPEYIHNYVFNGKFLNYCTNENSSDWVLYMFRAIEDLYNGDPEMALEFINRSLEIEGNWLNSITKSLILMNSEDFAFETAQEADDILKKLEKSDPQIPSIHLLRSIILAFSLGEYDESLKEIEAARKIEPYNYNSVLTDVLIRITGGDLESTGKIIDDFSRNNKINDFGMWYQVSMLKAYSLGNLEKGVQYILDITKDMTEYEGFGNWIEMFRDRAPFIPEVLYVENLFVRFDYPLNDPNIHMLPDKVAEAIKIMGYT